MILHGRNGFAHRILLGCLNVPSKMAEGGLANRYHVPIYNYCITSNHVHWTESLAIGDRIFVESAAKSIGNRSRFIYSDAGTSSPSATCVYEAGESYSSN